MAGWMAGLGGMFQGAAQGADIYQRLKQQALENSLRQRQQQAEETERAQMQNFRRQQLGLQQNEADTATRQRDEANVLSAWGKMGGGDYPASVREQLPASLRDILGKTVTTGQQYEPVSNSLKTVDADPNDPNAGPTQSVYRMETPADLKMQQTQLTEAARTSRAVAAIQQRDRAQQQRNELQLQLSQTVDANTRARLQVQIEALDRQKEHWNQQAQMNMFGLQNEADRNVIGAARASRPMPVFDPQTMRNIITPGAKVEGFTPRKMPDPKGLLIK